MPYLIPEFAKSPDRVSPPIRGFCVFLPDDPDCLADFVGALTFFTKWVAWERDNDKNGRYMASLWLAAFEQTMLNFYTSEGCGDMAEPCTVVVNNYVNCGCGASSTDTMYCVNDDGTITINPPAIPDQPVPPEIPLPDDMTEPPDPFEPGTGEPPAGWGDWGEYDEDACRAANSMVSYAHEFFYQGGTFLTEDLFTMAAALVVIVNVLTHPAGFLVLFDRGLILKIVEIVGRLSIVEPAGEAFLAISEWIEENRQELVCDLYTARGDAASWENTLIANIFQFAETIFYTEGGKGFLADMLSFMLPGGLALNLLYKNINYDGDVSINCGQCDDPLSDVHCLPDGFRSVTFTSMTPVKIESQCGNVSVSGLYDPATGQFELTYTITPGTCSLGKFRADFFTTDATATNIRLWIASGLAMTGPTTLNFGGLTLTPGAAPIDAAYRVNSAWTTCLQEYFTVDTSVRTANQNTFLSTGNVGATSRTWVISGKMRAYNYEGV